MSNPISGLYENNFGVAGWSLLLGKRAFPSTLGAFFPVIAKEYFLARPKGGLHKPEFGSSIAVMETSIYEFVLSELVKAKGHWPAISNGTGISRRTIEKIARKEVSNPGVKHIQTLAEYFKRAA